MSDNEHKGPPEPLHPVHPIVDTQFWVDKWQTELEYIRVVVQFCIAPGLPFIFLMNLVHSGAFQAPDKLALWSVQNPRYTLLGTGVVASFFSWLTANNWSQVIQMLARKRALHRTSFLEIETLAALKTGGTVWSWKVPYTPITLFNAFWLALLTTGYTTLLTPLAIVQVSEISGWEPNFLDQTDFCSSWFTANNLHNPSSCTWTTVGNVTINTCGTSNQVLDVLEIGRSTMVRQLNSQLQALSGIQFNDNIPVYTLDGVHFAGRTGGSLPQGPAGVSFLDTTGAVVKGFSANSSMHYQGVSAFVTCAQTQGSPIVTGTTNKGVGAGVNCTGPTESPSISLLPTGSFGNNAHLVAGIACNATSTPNQRNFTLYVSALGPFGNRTDIGTDEQDVGDITCQISTSVVDGVASYDSITNSFSWTPNNVIEAQEPAFDVAGDGASDLQSLFADLQFSDEGNLIIDSINSVYYPFVSPYLKNSDVQLDFPSLLAEFLRGVLEYEASWLRSLFMLQMINEGTDRSFTNNPCSRNVTGTISISIPGWDVGSHVAVAFVPVAVMGVLTLFLFGVVLLMNPKHSDRRLPVFNPTNLVSLSSAVVSAGNHFEFNDIHQLTLQPRDLNARSTTVRYRRKAEDHTWIYSTEPDSDQDPESLPQLGAQARQ